MRILNGNLTLTQPSELNANVTKQDVTSCDAVNGSLALSNIGGGSGAYEFSIDGGNSWSDQLNFNNLPAASYIVLVRDANDVNCFKLLGTYVIDAPNPIIASAVTNNVTGCFGRLNGSIIVTATGGSGQFEYSIDGGNSWSTSPSFTNLGAGTYDIRVRDRISPSCFRIINPSAFLTQPAQLNASLVKTNVTGCFGNNDGTITIVNPIGGSGTYEFSIDGGASWANTNAFTGLIAGTYNVRIRNQGDPNCNAIVNSSVVIEQPQQLSGNVQSTNVTCNGAADGTITFINVQPTSVTFQYSIDGGASWFSTPNFTGVAPGIYSVRIRNANFLSCVVSLGTLTITQPAALNASVNVTNVTSCAANPNGAIAITNLSGGSGAYEISINGGVNWSQAFNFTSLPAGTYVVQIRDANSTACVRSLGSYTLTQPAAISASLVVQDVTGCSGNLNGSITIINATGGSNIYDYTINGTTWSANSSFTGLGAGTYNVRIRDQLNPSCFFVINSALTITEPSRLTGTVLQDNITGCNGASNGAIVISNPAGGSGNYEFSITGGNVWQTSNIFSNLTAGTYDVRIRNRNDDTCNEALLIVVLTQPDPIVATILSGNPTCNGSTDGFITIVGAINGSGTYQYSINGGLLWSNSASFPNLGAGNYFVIIRDANNPTCTAILNSTFTLTEPAQLQATVNKTDVTSCAAAANGTITLSAISGGSGSYQFSIDGGQTWTTTPNFTGLSAGSYDIRIRNAAPPLCAQSLGTVTILQPGQLTATVTSINVSGCNGNNNGRIIIDNTAGGSGNYQYSIDGGLTWPGSGTTYTFNNLPAGVYNVRMRDANALQCVVTLNSALAITQPDVLRATLSFTNPTCNGTANGVIEVSNPVGGSGAYEYSVTGGVNWQPNNVFNGLPANTYVVRIRDLNNPICTATIREVTLTQPDALAANFTVGDVTGCNGGSNGSITFVTPTGGSGNYEFSINGGLNWSTTPIFSGLSAGSYNLFIRDLLNPLCVRQLQTGVVLSEPAQLVANFTVTNVTGCTGNNNGIIEFTNPIGGSGQFEFSIDGGNTWTRDLIFRNLQAGFYDLRIRDRNLPTCRRTINNNVQLTEPAPLTAIASATNESGCSGANNGTITITNVSGGSGQYYFTIDGGSTWLLGQTSFSGLGAGTYNVRMYDAINPSCIFTINSNLTILPVSPLSGNATATQVTCFGGSNGTITITNVTGGSGTYQYSVRPNEWQNTPVFVNMSAGAYLVRVRDAINQNCVFVINNALVVTQRQELDANITVNAVTGCNGNNNGSIEISNPTGGSGAYRYSVNGGASFQASPSFRNLPAGIYNIVIGDAADFSCTRILATNIRVNEPGLLSAQVRVTPVGCAGGTGIIEVVNPSGGSGAYQFSVNGGGTYSNSNTFVVRAGVYDVRVRDLVDPNCVFIVSTTVAVSEPALLNAEVNKTDVTGCNGNFNGTITVSNATGGSGEYEYSYDGGLSWTTNRSRGLLSAGVYDVRIRDRNFPDCFRSLETVTINEPLGITASFTSTGLVCAGASNGVIIFTNVQGGGGQYEYSIDGGITWRPDNTFTGLPGGTYDLRVRELGNSSCVTIVNRNVVLFEPAPLSAQVQTVNVQGCSNLNNGQIRITNPQGGSGGYQFSLNGGGWQTNDAFMNLPTGIYTLRIRDAANTNCVVVVGTYSIFGPTELSARITLDQVTCNGGTGVLTITNPQGGSGQYRYSIDGGNTWFTSPRFNVRAGQYDVRIQDLNFLACVATINSTYVVTEPGRLQATLLATNVSGCNGSANGSIQFTNQTGGSGVYEYSINGGLTWSSNSTFNNLTAGNYNIRIRDANDIQCDVLLRLTLQITEPARITASFTKRDLDCADASNGQIQFTTPQGGSGNYEYSINGGQTWQTGSLFANIPGGLYDLRIREASTPSCVSIVASRVDVREPERLDARITTTPEQGCEGENNGTITFSNTSGGSGGYQFSLNDGPWLLGPTISGLAQGLYRVRIRDAANPSCIRDLGVVQVFGPEPLAAQISISPITCSNGTGILRIVNISGGSGQYRYSVDGGNTWYTSNTFSVEAGQYDVRIQDLTFPRCSLIVNSSYAVDAPAQLDARISSENVTGCAGNANGSITISAPTGGSGQYEYSFDGGVTWSANPRVTLIRSGFYDVRIRDARDVNCVRVLNGSLAITEPAGLRADFQRVNLTCFGGANGSITFLNPQGGSGTYEYSIDGGLTWRNTTTFTGLNGGVYDLRIRAFGNPTCTAVVNSSVTIFEPTELNTTVLTTNVTGCDATNNGAITFTNSVGGSGNYQYSISGGGWVNAPVISGLSAGFYTVRIRDAANPTCIKTIGTFTIFSPAPLAAVIRTNPIECNGGFTTLTIVNPTGGSGSYRFSINGGADWFNSNSFNVRSGIYDVRIQDANFPQCTQVISGNFNVSQPQQLNATVTVVAVTGCNGNRNGSITFSNPTGGTGLYRYSIDGGVNWFQNNNFTNLPAGRYSVAIEDLNTPGCFRVINANLLVNEPDPLSGQVSSVNVTGCAGNNNGQIVITNPLGGSGNYRFSIDGGQQWFSSPIFTDLTAGTYSVRMYDVIQPTCIRVLNSNLVITEPTPLAADVQVTNITCFGQSDGRVVITSPTGGSERYEFSIDGETWRENTFQGITYTGIGPGRYTIRMRDFNERSCVVTLRANVNFTEPAPLVGGATSTNVTACFGNTNGSITFTGVAGGSGQYDYSIDGGQTWFPTSTFNTVGAGSYTAMIRDRQFTTCMQTVRENIEITQPTQLTADVLTTNVTGCANETNGTIEVRNAAGGSGSFQYSINGGLSWQNGTTFSNLPAALYAVAIRDAANPSCVRILSGSVNLTAPTAIVPTIVGFTNTTCSNSNTGTITLNVTGGTAPFTFQWSNGARTQNLTGLQAGTYTVNITDANGCSATATQTIIAEQTGIGPDVVAVWTNPSCTGTNTGTITASAVIVGRVPIPTFEYSLDQLNWQRSNFFSNLSPGSYTVYARVVNEFCVGSFNLTISTGGGPSQVTVSNITQTSAVVTWLPPAGASTYNLRYRVLNTTTWTTISNIPTSSATLTGLQAGTTYEVQVQVLCQSGNTSSFTESIQFTTQAGGGACPTPGGLAVTTVNTTTVRVSWSPSAGAICYIISWGVASSNANNWPTQTVTHPNTSFQITGLTPNLNYQVRIRSNCSACSPFSGTRSNWSGFVNFTTTQGRSEALEWVEESVDALSEVKVYPNPNQGNFTVSFEAADAADAQVSLHDLAGRRVHSETVRVVAGSNQLPIQLNDVPAGLYFLRLQVGTLETAPIKIIVH